MAADVWRRASFEVAIISHFTSGYLSVVNLCGFTSTAIPPTPPVHLPPISSAVLVARAFHRTATSTRSVSDAHLH